jgi:hypothetical protein
VHRVGTSTVVIGPSGLVTCRRLSGHCSAEFLSVCITYENHVIKDSLRGYCSMSRAGLAICSRGDKAVSQPCTPGIEFEGSLQSLAAAAFL